MKKLIIIGLGNPGKKYQNNRHNVGHLFIDYLQKNPFDFTEKIILLKTDCFMNLSGQFVKKVIKKFGRQIIDQIIIVHDDLDIPLGKFRLDLARGPKLHKGIKSIEETLKTNKFWRLRIGVDNRTAQNRVNGETYVLQNFLPEEKKILLSTLPKITTAIKLLSVKLLNQ